ncbi:MAG: hypothetical protein K6G80_10225 [Treponema sp.]|nr:hypothetical protein [Treponema sp.]
MASYVNCVKKHECTIVYAEKAGKKALCIELRPSKEKGYTWFVQQERADRNEKPSEEARTALTAWHERHGIEARE